jgi:hypothetical protein
MNNMVLKFISKFKKYNSDALEYTFMNGYCYYFSIILQERFGGEILYDQIEGHFLFLYKDNLYDIRGNVTHLYDISKLINKDEWLRMDSIIRGVILKIDD